LNKIYIQNQRTESLDRDSGEKEVLGAKIVRNLVVGFVIVALFSSMIQLNSLVAMGASVTTAPNCYAEIIASGLDGPHNLAIDKAGSVFVANAGYSTPPDYLAGTVITEITPDGQVTSFASGFVGPSGMAFDKKGTLWVSDDWHLYESLGSNIWKIDRDGLVTPGVTFETAAQFDNPNTLAFDKDWNLFVVTTGLNPAIDPGEIWKISPSGEVSFFAGGFSCPQAIAFDKQGYVYTADADGKIWKLDPSGSTRSLYAKVNGNQGNFAFDEEGNLYVPENTGKIVVISPSGTIKTLMQGMVAPRGVTFGKHGSLYVSDYNTGIVYKVTIGKMTHKIDVYPGQSIQLAVDWANEGDKIIVHQGTYNEKIVVNKPLTLKSEGAIIDLQGIIFTDSYPGNPDNAGIQVLSPGVTISGFKIINVPPGPSGSTFTFGIRFFGAFSGGLAEDNEIESNYFGIGINGNFQTAGVSEVTVRNNIVTGPFPISLFNAPNAAVINNEIAGIFVPSRPTSKPTGITTLSYADTPWSDGCLIANNQINSEYLGLSINAQTSITNIEIRNNDISTILGIIANNAPLMEIRNNLIQTDGIRDGVQISGGSDIEIKNNEIHGGFAAVEAHNSPNIAIMNNELFARAVFANPSDPNSNLCNGIFVDGASSTGALIKNNDITSEIFGIYVGSPPQTPGPADVQVIGNFVHNSVIAIQANNAPRILVEDNTMYAKVPTVTTNLYPNGIFLNGYSPDATIQNNDITSDRVGIYTTVDNTLAAPSNILIKNNVIHESTSAISVNRFSGNIIVEDNTVLAKKSQNYGAVQPFGIVITQDSSGPTTDVQVTSNAVTSEYYGIQITGVAGFNTLNSRVHGNVVNSIIAIKADNTPNIEISLNTASANANPNFANIMPAGIQLSGVLPQGSTELIEDNIIDSEFYGILIIGGVKPDVQIRNNIISTAIYAIWAGGTPTVQIAGNEVTAKRSATYPNNNPNGIILSTGSNDALIENNKITSDLFGIWFYGCSNVRIQTNTVTNAVVGIQAAWSLNSGAIISGNIVAVKANPDYPTRNAMGISLQGTNLNSLIENNEINSDYFGIELEAYNITTNDITVAHYPQNARIQNNKVFSSLDAIYAFGAQTLTITGNQLDADNWGIRLPMMFWTSAQVTNNVIHSGSTGILAIQVDHAIIRNNEIEIFSGVMPTSGILMTGDYGDISNNGISGEFRNGVTLNDGVINGVAHGVSNTLNFNTIIGGTVNEPDYGIFLTTGTAGNIGSGNIISGVTYPIADFGTGNVVT
jgi:parallel beta-helix repeat protein